MVHLPVPAMCCHEAVSPVKATYIICLAYEEQLSFTGVWLNHNRVAGTGKYKLIAQ